MYELINFLDYTIKKKMLLNFYYLNNVVTGHNIPY